MTVVPSLKYMTVDHAKTLLGQLWLVLSEFKTNQCEQRRELNAQEFNVDDASNEEEYHRYEKARTFGNTHQWEDMPQHYTFKCHTYHARNAILDNCDGAEKIMLEVNASADFLTPTQQNNPRSVVDYQADLRSLIETVMQNAGVQSYSILGKQLWDSNPGYFKRERNGFDDVGYKYNLSFNKADKEKIMRAIEDTSNHINADDIPNHKVHSAHAVTQPEAILNAI